jgi:hypothetical protein
MFQLINILTERTVSKDATFTQRSWSIRESPLLTEREMGLFEEISQRAVDYFDRVAVATKYILVSDDDPERLQFRVCRTRLSLPPKTATGIRVYISPVEEDQHSLQIPNSRYLWQDFKRCTMGRAMPISASIYYGPMPPPPPSPPPLSPPHPEDAAHVIHPLTFDITQDLYNSLTAEIPEIFDLFPELLEEFRGHIPPFIAQGDVPNELGPISQTLFPPPPPPAPSNVSPHVGKIVLSHAILTGAECPITLEPIQRIPTVAVGYCGHIFCKDVEVEERCPVCREPTFWTIVENINIPTE